MAGSVGLDDRWLVDYNTVEGMVRDVKETVVKERQFSVGTVQHALLSNRLRTLLPQVEVQVSDLASRLDSWELHTLTPPERERRVRLCERLQSSLKKSYMAFSERKELTGNTAVEEDEGEGSSSHLSIGHLRQQQQHLLQEQDEGLDVLSGIVSQQKRYASAIGTEVEQQNEILDDITHRTNNVSNRLEDETHNITTTTRKTRTWPYWVVISLLLVAIVVVVVW